LSTALNNAVAQRHLQVYFNNTPAEVEMTKISWSGGLGTPKVGQELIAEVEANYGGTKTNHFLDRMFDLDLNYQDGKLHHKLTITLTDKAPDGYEGGRHYTAYVRLYTPANATDVKVTGLGPTGFPADESPKDLRVMDGQVQITIPPFPSTKTVTFEYTTDVHDLSSGHEIYWQKQAGTLNDPVKVTYHVNGRTYTANGDLNFDRLLLLTEQGVQIKQGVSGGAKLPLIGA
jgi:hypothetical protein